jgi:hypothetical protein
MWCRLSDLKALQLSVLWAFEIFTCSKCSSLLLYKRYLFYVVNVMIECVYNNYGVLNYQCFVL